MNGRCSCSGWPTRSWPKTVGRRSTATYSQRYAITPLSQNCGIIGWVPACDTLHALVRDFRDARKVVLNVEHRVMLQLAPDYDALTLPQKVEVFHAALANTAGHDLSKVPGSRVRIRSSGSSGGPTTLEVW